MNSRIFVFFLAISAFSINIFAQQYPVRPLRFVVPFPPGGSPDANARALGRQLQYGLKQSVIIDNRSGADGIIGSDFVAKAQPDGYTFLFSGQAFLTNAALHSKLPYDIKKDFAPLTQVVVSDGYVLVVNSSLRINNPAELIEQSKIPQKPIRYGSPGIGSSQQLAAELFNVSSGALLMHVPYRGLGPAITALLAGDEVQVGLIPLTIVAPHMSSGRLRAIAITAGERWKSWPDIPTVSETLPGFKFAGGWHGLFAPANTPQPILTRIHSEVQRALAAPELMEYFRIGGYEPIGSSPSQFRDYVNSDLDRWIELARVAKISPK